MLKSSIQMDYCNLKSRLKFSMRCQIALSLPNHIMKTCEKTSAKTSQNMLTIRLGPLVDGKFKKTSFLGLKSFYFLSKHYYPQWNVIIVGIHNIQASLKAHFFLMFKFFLYAPVLQTILNVSWVEFTLG